MKFNNSKSGPQMGEELQIQSAQFSVCYCDTNCEFFFFRNLLNSDKHLYNKAFHFRPTLCCSPSKIIYTERTNKTHRKEWIKEKRLTKVGQLAFLKLIMQWVRVCMWMEFDFINSATSGCWYVSRLMIIFWRPKIIMDETFWNINRRIKDTDMDTAKPWIPNEKLNSNYAKNTTMKPTPIGGWWIAMVVESLPW